MLISRNSFALCNAALLAYSLVLLFSPAQSHAQETNNIGTDFGIQASNCNVATPNGYFWTGNPSIGLLCPTGTYPPVYYPYFDKPVGTILNICPGQYVPSNWTVKGEIKNVGAPCGAPSIFVTKWVVIRNG